MNVTHGVIVTNGLLRRLEKLGVGVVSADGLLYDSVVFMAYNPVRVKGVNVGSALQGVSMQKQMCAKKKGGFSRGCV